MVSAGLLLYRRPKPLSHHAWIVIFFFVFYYQVGAELQFKFLLSFVFQVGAVAAAAAAADMAPVRDLIRLDLLAAGGQLPPVSFRSICVTFV